MDLAILPAGTGNLVAANLGLSTDLAAGIEVALDGSRRQRMNSENLGGCPEAGYLVRPVAERLRGGFSAPA